MSQANAEVVRRMFNAGNRRDVPTLEGRISEDCELHSVLAATEGRVFRERQGIRDYFAELGSAFAEFQYEIEKVMDTGEDRVVALVKFTARG
jgi:ketosteroid isomerase-like protein